MITAVSHLFRGPAALTLVRRIYLVSSLLAFLLANPSALYPQAPATSSNQLVGLWGTERSFGPLVRGTITIDGRQPQWRAEIAGFEVPVERNGDRLSFLLPDGAGEFRGQLDSTLKTIRGQWIQPVGAVNNNRYATPVRLVTASQSVWTGRVVPLDDEVSFYLSIKAQPDGSTTAVIVNPEFNLFRRRSYIITSTGSNVTFANAKNTRDHFDGTLNKESDRLFLPLLDGSPPLAFSRRDRGGALNFYSRTPDASKYTYIKPVAGDGWTTASLDDVGLSEKPIAALIEQILTADPSNNPVDIDSLLIARHGRLVLEEYFHGFDKERPHDMRSASKTLAPMLAGIARDHGVHFSPDTPLESLFPKEKPFAHRDARKSDVTLKTLMTMTSGLACDDNDDASPGNEDNMQNQTVQPDWYRYTLDLPMAAEPGGQHAVYCSADLNLVGGAVARATHTWLPDFFERYLASPLQFGAYYINLMPTGEAYMGGGLYLRPRDELKLGQLYLSGGLWHGSRVISQDWVRQSTTASSTFDPQSEYDAPHEYGFGWHINHLRGGDRTFLAYSAGGNGGQIIMVIPDLDLVVGINGRSYGEFTKWYRWGLQLVPQYIIPALVPNGQASSKSPMAIPHELPAH
jgi:CubicO group peptidase (beta-lactamase class C family)